MLRPLAKRLATAKPSARPAEPPRVRVSYVPGFGFSRNQHPWSTTFAIATLALVFIHLPFAAGFLLPANLLEHNVLSEFPTTKELVAPVNASRNPQPVPPIKGNDKDTNHTFTGSKVPHAATVAACSEYGLLGLARVNVRLREGQLLLHTCCFFAAALQSPLAETFVSNRNGL